MSNTVYCLEHKQHAELCDHGGHYHIYGFSSIDDIKRVFPEGKANKLNWFVASTSGVHGTYTTLDKIEKSLSLPIDDEERFTELTCLIIMPRMVCVTYGCIEVKSQEEVDFLRKLITSSIEQIAKTQAQNVTPITNKDNLK